MYEQDPLFDLPSPARRVPKLAAASGKPRYTKVSLRRRVLCDDCVTAVHVLGVAVAPLPMPVRWRRTHAGESTLLCLVHKIERLENET